MKERGPLGMLCAAYQWDHQEHGPQENPTMLYLAIDQHSQQLTMNVRDETGRVLQRRQVSTRGTAVREFLAALPLHDRAGGGGDGG